MFCDKCGAELIGASVYCSSCGQRVMNNVPSISQQKRKHTTRISKILKIAIGIVGAILMILVISWLLTPDPIDMIQRSILNGYDYGKPIGQALNDWFDGSVTWDSYEENETTYVYARGYCPYAYDYDANQTFLFVIVDDEHFRFLEAVDSDGKPIFTNSSNCWDNWYADAYSSLLSIFGSSFDTYDMALQAAFGNQEMFEAIKNANAENAL